MFFYGYGVGVRGKDDLKNGEVEIGIEIERGPWAVEHRGVGEDAEITEGHSFL